jgi:hypothetical protein
MLRILQLFFLEWSTAWSAATAEGPRGRGPREWMMNSNGT